MAEFIERSIQLQNYEKSWLLELYREMVKQRTFDRQLIRLLQEGRVSGFYHSGIGQEATAAGTCAVLRDDDVIFYNHRGCNQMIAKGVPLDRLYGDFLCTLHGTTRGLGAGIVHSAYPEKGVLGQSGTLGGCFVISVGVAHGIKIKKTDQVCVCYFGDGTSARETFHGGLNWAALYKLPVIFFLENNEYGKTTHYTRAHGLKNYIADRAEGYGIPAYVIDGNDVLLVYEVTKEAVERARRDKLPTFIEAKTFRHRGHFEGEAYNYVDTKMLDEWKTKRDPIKNFQESLLNTGIASEDEFTGIDREIEEDILKAIEVAASAPLPDESRIYQGLFSLGGEQE